MAAQVSNKSKEWERYRCELPVGGRSLRQTDCAVLTDVYHVAHVSDARRIIEDKCLRARIVYDESKLNRTRTHVCWVSANTWAEGSIYGTVEFAFKWSDVIGGKKIYWVEAMTQYSPPAYRFLLTRDDHSDLVSYDPKSADGPLRKRGKEWYWNGDYCAEFMVEEDLSLNLCWRIHFLNHHRNLCRLNGSGCAERRQLPHQSAASIVGYLIGVGNKSLNDALLPDIGLPNGRRSTSAIDVAADGLWRRLARDNEFRQKITSKPDTKRVLRAALLQQALDGREDARNLVQMFSSLKAFDKGLEDIIKDHFGLDEFKLSS